MAETSLSLAEFSEHFRSSEEKRRLRQFRGGSNVPSPVHSAHGVLIRTSLQKRTFQSKAKKVRFYRNGDRFFKGLMYAVSTERFRTFESLLADLTRTLSDKSHLPQGVRQIFTVDGSRRITAMDQLIPGESYVCASQEIFKRIDYQCANDPAWKCGNVKREKDGRESYSPVPKGMDGQFMDDHRGFIKPRLVTIIKSGAKPRKAVRVLLNKKTAHTFDQVLTDITDAIKLDSGVVRKLYTLDGRQVTSLQDFFKDDDVFMAYGQERSCHDDFDVSVNECRTLTPYRKEPKKDRVMIRSPGLKRKTTPPKKAPQNGHGSPLLSRAARTGSPTKSRSPGSPGSVKSGSRPGSAKSGSRPESGRSRSKENLRTSSGSQNGEKFSTMPIDIDSAVVLPAELEEKYDILQLIGNGNFAVVKECRNKITGDDFALKIIDKNKCRGKEQMIENEVSILRSVNHTNIILLVEEYDTPSELYLVMELVKGGDLFDAISSATKYTERDASCMIHNLYSALDYLHAMNIVHRDIKPENLLVCQHQDGSKSLKLGDFGLATVVDGPLFTVCGTPTYVAPEIILEAGYGLKVDIWAAGVITYILLCGFPPFRSESNSQDEVFDKIVACDYSFTSPYWDGISESAKQLISCMLTADVNQRYSASDVLGHPWLADDDAINDDTPLDVSSLSTNFEIKPKASDNAAGIALVAATALDIDGKYFQGIRGREGADGADSPPVIENAN